VRDKYGLRYSQFIHLKKLAHIDLNRKQLSEMIIKQPSHFEALIEKIRTYEKTPPSENSLASPAVS
jgi:ribosomal protein L20